MVFIISFIFGLVKLFSIKISKYEICEVNHFLCPMPENNRIKTNKAIISSSMPPLSVTFHDTKISAKNQVIFS